MNVPEEDRSPVAVVLYYSFVWCMVSLCDVGSFDRFTGTDRCCLGPSGFRNLLLSISSCEHRLQTSALKHSPKLVKTRPSFQARLASSWWWTQKSLRNTRACHGCEDCVLFVLFLHVSSSSIDAYWCMLQLHLVPMFFAFMMPGTQSWRLDRVHEFTHWLMLTVSFARRVKTHLFCRATRAQEALARYCNLLYLTFFWDWSLSGLRVWRTTLLVRQLEFAATVVARRQSTRFRCI